MIEIKQTAEFSGWLDSLVDRQAIARINTRIYRLAHGNPGDVKSVGEGVSELRIDYGRTHRRRRDVRSGEAPGTLISMTTLTPRRPGRPRGVIVPLPRPRPEEYSPPDQTALWPAQDFGDKPLPAAG